MKIRHDTSIMEIAADLAGRNLAVEDVVAGDGEVEGMITIYDCPNVVVEVGVGYAYVTTWAGITEALRQWPRRIDTKQLMFDLWDAAGTL